MIDYITGERFITLADYTFSPTKKVSGDYDNLPNTLNLIDLKDKDIIYTHTLYARELMEIIQYVNKSLIIVSHNSDVNIGFSPPDNVIKWFSQNVNIINPKIESIPIGLENERWLPAVHKKEKMMTKFQQTRNYRNLVYMNHNISTNPSARLKPYQLFEGKPWVTSVRGVNGNGFDEYLDNIYNHKFVICPRGNGLDTHRLWETLYMGSIPIVKKDINNWFYNDLPIYYVDNWEEVTEELLNSAFPSYYHCEWDDTKLTFEYWKNKILNLKNE